jgi:hypothetical protein
MLVPTWVKVKKCTSDISKPANTKLSAARNFPITKSKSLNGRVDITSIVPRFFSRAIRLIVIAGIKKRYTKGIMLNSERMSDWLKRKKVRVKKYPVITANMTRKI